MHRDPLLHKDDNAIQCSQRHSVIKHCDRRITTITPLSDTDIHNIYLLVCLIYNVFTYFDMPFG
jgi:hypothetical protein